MFSGTRPSCQSWPWCRSGLSTPIRSRIMATSTRPVTSRFGSPLVPSRARIRPARRTRSRLRWFGGQLSGTADAASGDDPYDFLATLTAHHRSGVCSILAFLHGAVAFTKGCSFRGLGYPSDRGWEHINARRRDRLLDRERLQVGPGLRLVRVLCMTSSRFIGDT